MRACLMQEYIVVLRCRKGVVGHIMHDDDKNRRKGVGKVAAKKESSTAKVRSNCFLYVRVRTGWSKKWGYLVW